MLICVCAKRIHGCVFLLVNVCVCTCATLLLRGHVRISLSILFHVRTLLCIYVRFYICTYAPVLTMLAPGCTSGPFCTHLRIRSMLYLWRQISERVTWEIKWKTYWVEKIHWWIKRGLYRFIWDGGWEWKASKQAGRQAGRQASSKLSKERKGPTYWLFQGMSWSEPQALALPPIDSTSQCSTVKVSGEKDETVDQEKDKKCNSVQKIVLHCTALHCAASQIITPKHKKRDCVRQNRNRM